MSAPWLQLVPTPEALDGPTAAMRVGGSSSPSAGQDALPASVHDLLGHRASLASDDDVPLPTAFANLRPHTPPPLQRTDSQREADLAWARAQAAETVAAVAPPDRALSRSAPPNLSSSSYGGSRSASPRTGADDEERYSEADGQDEVPDLPDLPEVFVGTAADTPALSFTVEGASPQQPASSAATPADDAEDEEDVPISATGRFASVLQRAFSPAPVRKETISPPPEEKPAHQPSALAPPSVSSPILLAAIAAYESQTNRSPTASHGHISPPTQHVISPPVLATPPLVIPRAEKPRSWSGPSSPQVAQQARFAMTTVTRRVLNSSTSSDGTINSSMLPAAIDLEALEDEAERSAPASRSASRRPSRRPSMAARMQSEEAVLGLSAAFDAARIALEKANAQGRRFEGPVYRPIMSPDDI